MSRRLTLWFVYWSTERGVHIAFEEAVITLCGRKCDIGIDTTISEQDMENGNHIRCDACLAMKRAVTAAAEGSR